MLVTNIGTFNLATKTRFGELYAFEVVEKVGMTVTQAHGLLPKDFPVVHPQSHTHGINLNPVKGSPSAWKTSIA